MVFITMVVMAFVLCSGCVSSHRLGRIRGRVGECLKISLVKGEGLGGGKEYKKIE